MLEQAVRNAVELGRKYTPQGRVADYIPELSKADPDSLGLCVFTCDGQEAACGDVETRFTIQSISKVISLSAALQFIGFDEVFRHVMMEPSGDAFNSILKLDLASNRPYNPMINAGAIEIVDLLEPRFTFNELLKFARRLCLDDDIQLNTDVYHSESDTGDRNRAISYLLKSKGVLQGDALDTIDLYFRLCSMSVNARTLAGLGLVLASGGINPRTGERLLDSRVVRAVKTLMFTCGMYDGSGEYACRVGIPSKSGVGGGIMGCVEGRMGLATYGPALDVRGNSIGGFHALEQLSHELHLHVFDSETAK